MFSCDVRLRAEPGGMLDADAAPATGAVVLLADREGRPVLLATTADARAFLRKRLGSPTAERAAPPAREEAAAALRGPGAGPRTDLSGVVASAELTLVGSGLEADLAFLAISRRAMPGTWAALTGRWRAWFIHLDPDAANPVWRKTNLGDIAPGSPPAPGHLIGPIANKDTAGRFGEAIDDLFDLCRFPRELALAPRGTACAYKEMGRCPAPCDGSEALPHYRARVREALDLLRREPEERAEAVELAMREAAAAMDFELAARHKSRLDRLAQIAKPAMRNARPLDTFRFVGIMGSGRPGWGRAWWIDTRGCAPLADLDGSRPKSAVAALMEAMHAASGWRSGGGMQAPSGAGKAPGGPPDPVLMGIIARHLLAPGARRRGGFLRIPPQGSTGPGAFDEAAAARLLRSASRTDGADVEEFDRAALV